MVYRIGREERIPDAVRRIAREEIDGALHALATAEPDVAVHTIRKHFKKLRALLRLLRGTMGRDEARSRGALFRDAARTLAEARDSRIVIDGTEALAAAGEGPSRDALLRLGAALAERHTATMRAVVEPGGALATLGPSLEHLRGEVAAWNLPERGFEALAPGLRRTYARGRRALTVALASPTAENLHAWRKRVKDLGYHVNLLQDVWPEGLAPLVDALGDLADRLGLDHDHAVLDERLAREPDLAPDPTERALIDAAVDAARSQLQADAWPLGQRVWSEEADAFVARVEGYWDAWRR